MRLLSENMLQFPCVCVYIRPFKQGACASFHVMLIPNRYVHIYRVHSRTHAILVLQNFYANVTGASQCDRCPANSETAVR
eukprot:509086-Pelagomonas_calceolata.AAC.1